MCRVSSSAHVTGNIEIYSVFWPLSTVAAAVKAMFRYCVRFFYVIRILIFSHLLFQLYEFTLNRGLFYILFQGFRYMCACAYIYTQGVSRLVDITAGGDFLGLCDQKSSYKHVSDFGRLRSYDRLKLRIEGTTLTINGTK